ncbi:MAG: class I SAM-dependent methyltransferase, partial [Tomitella sp.]|nr:class I SAM-dependent methyltransferase [Tomitella sp.]
MTTEAERWNHNIHYHRLVLDAVPLDAKNALEVGCGEGLLARRLHRIVPQVVGIDTDGPSIMMARARTPDGDVDYVHDDFLTHPFTLGSFDVIVSVAAVHHMDAAPALKRMRDLLLPGGTLVIVGLARSQLPADIPIEVASAITSLAANSAHRLTKSYWQHPSPTVWPPPETYRDMRRLAAQLLPGSRYRRHLLWRYSIVWT